MTHVRTQIIDAVKTAITGLSTTGNRVFKQRRYPTSSPKLPCWLIYRGSEISEPDEQGSPRLISRTFDFHLEGLAEGTTADDVLDTMAAEAEAVLAADLNLGGLCHNIQIATTEPGPVLDSQSEKQVASLRLTFRVEYLTTDQDPETAA